jgi:hypothetical protein
MDDFELACLQLLVKNSLLEPDVLRQLSFLSVTSRLHDREGRRTIFRVAANAPPIVPGDLKVGSVFEIANISQSVDVHLWVAGGMIRELGIDHPNVGWPEQPQLLGLAQYPEP